MYNCGKSLAFSIRSILNQTWEDWELLVIDDGSTDDTLEVVRSFMDPRLKVSADGTHKGLVFRLNEAIHKSRGKYFARMDGDDVAFPDRLQRQTRFLEANELVDLVGCAVIVFDKSGSPVGTRRVAENHVEICRRPWAGFPLPHPTWLGRSEWFRKHGYDARAVRAEDQVLLLRAYAASCFACLPEILQGYQESELVLGRILRGRFSFTRAVFQNFCQRKEYATALSGTLEQCIKGLADIFAISTGLNYRILRHRALPVATEMARRWSEVWTRVQLETQPRILCGK